MLGRSLPQSAMLAERLFSGALAETLAQACGGSGTASGAARWSLSSQGLLLLRSVKGCFSTAAADAAGALSIHPSAAAVSSCAVFFFEGPPHATPPGCRSSLAA